MYRISGMLCVITTYVDVHAHIHGSLRIYGYPVYPCVQGHSPRTGGYGGYVDAHTRCACTTPTLLFAHAAHDHVRDVVFHVSAEDARDAHPTAHVLRGYAPRGCTRDIPYILGYPRIRGCSRIRCGGRWIRGVHHIIASRDHA